MTDAIQVPSAKATAFLSRCVNVHKKAGDRIVVSVTAHYDTRTLSFDVYIKNDITGTQKYAFQVDNVREFVEHCELIGVPLLAQRLRALHSDMAAFSDEAALRAQTVVSFVM